MRKKEGSGFFQNKSQESKRNRHRKVSGAKKIRMCENSFGYHRDKIIRIILNLIT